MGVHQVGDPVQGDGGFSASCGTLHDQGGPHVRPDDFVLFHLDGGYDLLQPVVGVCPQVGLQEFIIGGDIDIEYLMELTSVNRNCLFSCSSPWMLPSGQL